MSETKHLIPYTPGAVINFFLECSWNSSNFISPMHLQKLLYFAQGWYLAKFNDEKDTIVPLINEPFQAWEYGPVISSVYHEFKSFGANKIREKHFMTELAILQNPLNVEILINKISKEDQLTTKHLEEIWKKYSQHTATELSEMTHIDDPENPWLLARKAGMKEGITRGKEISNSTIKKYFLKLRLENKEF